MTGPLVFGQPPADNSLFYGDCLDWMRRWPDNCVNLIYLDPPFNSKQDYNMLYSAQVAGDAQYRAFADTWVWDDAAADRLDGYMGAIARPAHNAIAGLNRMLGQSGMLAYLTYMAERLEECWRLLAPTGGIYLHCDPTASHYLKAVMDGIFGAGNFRSEIIWKRTYAHGRALRWGPVHDVLLFYSKTDKWTWNRTYQAYDPFYVEKNYRHKDKHGRYRHVTLDGPGTRGGPSGLPWRGVDPTVAGRHWEVPPDRALPPWINLPDGYPHMTVQERLDVLDEQGLIYWPPKGTKPSYRRYLSVAPGNQIQDVVTDISAIGARAAERLGYPTQKPRALLERIIEASSNKGDLVLDPFCGCGTAVDAAQRLGRRWIGVDISSFAVDVMLERLGDRTIPVYGIPYDLHSARRMAADDPFGFETWAVNRLRGFVPNTKQVADGGIDGRAHLAVQPDDWKSRLALAQVKGGKHHPIDGLRAFSSVVDRRKAALGCYITVEPFNTASARKVATSPSTIHVGGYPYQRFHRWSIADYFDERPPPLPPMNNPYTGKPMAQGELF
ncbi:MAG: DNA methyltransferase [bacterium]|nr:DNA methyltransferase [bacterium]